MTWQQNFKFGLLKPKFGLEFGTVNRLHLVLKLVELKKFLISPLKEVQGAYTNVYWGLCL